MSSSARLRDMALMLIQRNGGPMTLTLDTEASYDPVTQAPTGAGSTVWNLTGVMLPPGRSNHFAPGSLVGRNVMEVWTATNDVSVQPAVGQVLNAAGYDWKLVHVTLYMPDGAIPIVWKFYVER